MKLPNSNKVIIPKEKLIDYLLSETHPVGNSKAKFFRGFGYNETNAGELAKLLLHIAQTNDVKSVRKLAYGTNHLIEGTIKTPNGKTVTITTV